jgi:FAD/FMN-containing dehydrogenase
LGWKTRGALDALCRLALDPGRNDRKERDMATILDDAHVGSLSERITGTVLRPHDPGYDEARAVHNGMVDRKPALIVRCLTADDVVAALAFARGAGLEVSIRGGGHNVAGRAVTDGGLMVDLALMKGIAVDPVARTATVEGGVIWAELNDAAARHGLAVTGGTVSTTGVAGYTLGGGLGWLMSKYGLAADNLLAVELVTAGGEILHVDDSSHPDLFWALRGGGGNFGVATSFTFRLHPLRTIVGGLIAHPLDAGPELLRFYRDAVADASDDLTVFAGLVHAPDGSGAKLAALVVFHTGEIAEAERDLEPFETWGSPLVVQIGPMPYPVMNTILDAGYPTGSLNYWLSSFARGLSDELIETAVERFASVPSPLSAVLLEHFHGAVTRVGPTDTAVPHRGEGWNLLIPSVWMDPADTDANIAWTRDTFAALRRHFGTGRWLNYLGDDQADDAVRAAYGPNYERLREVKRRYDPANVFHLNHNIQ